MPEIIVRQNAVRQVLGHDSLQYGTLTSQGQQVWEDGYSNFLAGGGS